MKKYIKESLFLLGVLCFVLGSIAVIFVESIDIIDFSNGNISVNPSMAIISTAVVVLTGAIIFIKRNKFDK